MRVLLDSTYLLPIFGIEVVGLTVNDYRVLKRMVRKGVLTLYYSPISWVEIVGKIAREIMAAGKGGFRTDLAQDMVKAALDSITRSGVLQEVVPTARDLELALKMRLLGHRDVIDNLLYSMAFNNRMIFLSMDRALRDFVEENKGEGLDPGIIKDHKILFDETRSL